MPVLELITSAATFAAKTIAGHLVKEKWKSSINKVFPQKSFESSLRGVIIRTILEFKTTYSYEEKPGKFPFYSNQIVFDKLSRYTLFSHNGPENLISVIKANPDIIVPSQQEIQDFYGLFLDNIENDELLKKLFLDENYKEQVFINTQQLDSLFGLNTSIKRDTEEILGIVKKNNEYSVPTELTVNLPKLPKSKISGRFNDLEDLHDRLFSEKQVVLMNGMGGIGKTTLAMVYLTEYYNEYEHIAWITMSSQDFISDFTLTPGLLNLLGLTFSDIPLNTFHSIISSMKRLPGKSLMIIDNATDSLSPFFTSLPSQPDWHLLLTSREVIPNFDLKELGFLNEKDSLSLFKLHYSHQDIDDETIKEIIKNTEYHTLTIEILAKTAHYLRKSPEELNEAINRNIDSDVTTRHSDKKIGKIMFYLESIFDLSKLSVEDLSILKYIALLPSNFIPYKTIAEVLGFELDNLRKSLPSLVNKGWVLYNKDDDTYKVHKIINDVIISKMNYDLPFIEPLANRIANLLSVGDYDNSITKFKWVTYGLEILAKLDNTLIDKFGSLNNNLALVLQDLGEYERAKDLLEKAMLSAEKNLGVDHPTTAVSYSNLATVLKDLGEYGRAKELLEKAMLSDEKNLGVDHPSTAVSYSNLAMVLKDLGEYGRAKELLEKAMLSAEKNLGADHPRKALSYSNLALVLKALGEYGRAKELLEKAMLSAEKNLGVDHPTTAVRYSNLALVLQDLGEYERAKELLEKAILSYENKA